MADLVSRPYKPGDKCCQACVFGPFSGPHADWCEASAKHMAAAAERHARLERAEAGIRRRALLAKMPLSMLAFVLGGVKDIEGAPCLACVTGRGNHAEWCRNADQTETDKAA